jgi:hypothetical protein
MNPVEQYEVQGALSWPGGGEREVGYRLTRFQGVSGNGLPVPGLFRIEGAIDLRGEPVHDGVVGAPLTLRLADGRALGVTLATRDGRVLSEGHGPSRCLCC